MLRRTFVLATILAGLAGSIWSAKKDKEDQTQVLQLPKELPGAVVGETRKLAFYVTPLSAKGLLSQQVKDALKALEHQSGGDTVLQIRAFLAGTGDLRRVRDLVSHTFSDRHQPLPTLTVVQTGGLPLNGAQVELEAVAGARKELHPNGLAWISAQVADSDNPLDPVGPLADRSLANLSQAVTAAGAAPDGVLRVTCFLSSLDGVNSIRQKVAAAYPHSAVDLVQTQREPVRAVAACEAVADPAKRSGRLQVINPEGLPGAAGESQIALVGAEHVVLTGSQVCFGFEDKDARLAFERLGKELENAGISPRDVAFVRYYPLSQKIAGQVAKMRGGLFGAAPAPPGSLLLFEGLSSEDATFAVDVVAAKD